jgi:hypothetical protein
MRARQKRTLEYRGTFRLKHLGYEGPNLRQCLWIDGFEQGAEDACCNASASNA